MPVDVDYVPVQLLTIVSLWLVVSGRSTLKNRQKILLSVGWTPFRSCRFVCFLISVFCVLFIVCSVCWLFIVGLGSLQFLLSGAGKKMYLDEGEQKEQKGFCFG